MRSIRFRGITLAATIVLAMTMLAINIAFETAGSIPDLEGCGFVAGIHVALMILYPVAAAAIASRSSRILERGGGLSTADFSRHGVCLGMLGSLLYFLPGLAGAAHSLWYLQLLSLIALYATLSARDGRFGALFALRQVSVPAWGMSGS